jgi:hypothetical protein
VLHTSQGTERSRSKVPVCTHSCTLKADVVEFQSWAGMSAESRRKLGVMSNLK